VLAQQRRELAVITRKLDGLIEAIAEGLRSPGLQQKLAVIEAEKAALEAAIAESPSPAPRLHAR
jgi:site-specific DNA recombinase